MSERANEDELQENEGQLYAEEDPMVEAGAEGSSPQEELDATAQDDITVDFGEQADSLLEDIKSDGF